MNVDYIRSIITHPANFAGCVGEGDPTAWKPNMADNTVWLKAPGAVFMGFALTPVLWECHSAVVPEFRQRTKEYYQQAIDWMRENTTCRHLIGMIPEGNLLARVAAKAAGFKREGFMPNSRMHAGQLVGQYIYGVTL